MSYSVTIEAGTLIELNGKVLALAAQLNPQTTNPVMIEVEHKSAKPGKAKPAASSAETPAPSEEEEEAPASASPEATGVANVSDGDLRDLVIGLVKAKGREVMPPILAQFGVAKATEITDPAQRLELANALRDAMGD